MLTSLIQKMVSSTTMHDNHQNTTLQQQTKFITQALAAYTDQTLATSAASNIDTNSVEISTPSLLVTLTYTNIDLLIGYLLGENDVLHTESYDNTSLHDLIPIFFHH